jgi:hypothetical protein
MPLDTLLNSQPWTMLMSGCNNETRSKTQGLRNYLSSYLTALFGIVGLGLLEIIVQAKTPPEGLAPLGPVDDTTLINFVALTRTALGSGPRFLELVLDEPSQKFEERVCRTDFALYQSLRHDPKIATRVWTGRLLRPEDTETYLALHRYTFPVIDHPIDRYMMATNQWVMPEMTVLLKTANLLTLEINAILNAYRSRMDPRVLDAVHQLRISHL